MLAPGAEANRRPPAGNCPGSGAEEDHQPDQDAQDQQHEDTARAHERRVGDVEAATNAADRGERVGSRGPARMPPMMPILLALCILC
jgi:hypothetical protein